MLALIGPDWNSHGDVESALANPDDFVRVELLAALKQGIDVIPILVERTPMPREADLPEALRPLTRRNALELENARWNSDVNRLVSTLEQTSCGRKRHRSRIGTQRAREGHKTPAKRGNRRSTPAKRFAR